MCQVELERHRVTGVVVSNILNYWKEVDFEGFRECRRLKSNELFINNWENILCFFSKLLRSYDNGQTFESRRVHRMRKLEQHSINIIGHAFLHFLIYIATSLLIVRFYTKFNFVFGRVNRGENLFSVLKYEIKQQKKNRKKNHVNSKETYIWDRASDNMMHFVVVVIIAVVLEFIYASCV